VVEPAQFHVKLKAVRYPIGFNCHGILQRRRI
jgi:hypothetical protein